MPDDFFDFLVATDQLDDFLGYNENKKDVPNDNLEEISNVDLEEILDVDLENGKIEEDDEQ